MKDLRIDRRKALGRLLGFPALLAVASSGRRVLADSGKTCMPTAADVRGPFYLPDAPKRAALAGPNEPGERVAMTGTIYGSDCRTALSGALLDIWHADAAGNYHDQKEQYRLRGQILTGSDGTFRFESVRPGNYRFDGDMRPAHFHVTVSRPGYAAVTTQIYFKGDPHLAPKDPCEVCHSDDARRIVELARSVEEGKTRWSGRCDIVLRAES